MPQTSPAKRNSASEESAVPEVMTEKEIARSLGANSVAVKQNVPDFTSEELVGIESWDDIAGVIEAHGIDVVFADKVLGDGFSILSTDDKAQLVGRPMMLLEWRFNDGNMGEFVSIRAIVKTGDLPSDIRKVIINDGSTGIRQQLRDFTAQTGKQAGLLVRRGLRVSEYEFEDDNGVMRPAKTYYIDASA